MRWIETSGKTVEEAKRKAAQQLGVAEEDIEFEVLEVGAKGVLGIFGGTPARVRATYYESRKHRMSPPSTAGPAVRDFDPTIEENPLRRGRRRGGRGREDRPEQRSESRGQGRAPRESKEPQEPRGRSRQRPAKETAPAGESGQSGSGRPPRAPSRKPAEPAKPVEPQRPVEPPSAEGATPAAAGSGERGRRRPSRRRGGGRGARPDVEQVQAAPQPEPAALAQEPPRAATARRGAARTQQEGKSMEALANDALALVQQLLEAGSLGGSAQITEKSADGADIEVTGGQTAALVGRQGHTLDALQFLVSVIVNRGKENKFRITLEAGGFRKKHQETLVRTALELAEQVQEHQQEAELEPLPARDRLVIHNALKDHAAVYTYSEGEGDRRHVIISPKSPEGQ